MFSERGGRFPENRGRGSDSRRSYDTCEQREPHAPQRRFRSSGDISKGSEDAENVTGFTQTVEGDCFSNPNCSLPQKN